MTDHLSDTLLTTPLHALHVARGARMVPFAGYDMPLHYRPGIMVEHLQTRKSAGLFDVSHMGQIRLTPRSGRLQDAALALETLVPADILALNEERQRYTIFTNSGGGILDDLMVANLGSSLLLVVNAACKAADFAHLRHHLSTECDVETLDDRALIAVQGPLAQEAVSRLAPDTASMRFMDVCEQSIAGVACLVSRSGYTGEDGFEIGIEAKRATEVVEALLAQPEIQLAGLGARDSLRLEAGLCLYGADLDTKTTPVEAALEWSIQKSRRRGGAREGGFAGAAVILEQFSRGAARRRVGILPEGRAPLRAGTRLFAEEDSPAETGCITSGAFGPSVGAPVAMGYVASDRAVSGTKLFAELRGRPVAATVVSMPFVPLAQRR